MMLSSETLSSDFLLNNTTHDVMMSIKTKEHVLHVLDLVYQRECELYRGGNEVRPETKIIFLIGNGFENDLGKCNHFDDSPVRTKPAQYAKAPEVIEVLAEISAYLEKRPDITADKMYSEIADIFYNLFHLVHTDADFSLTYLKWIDTFAKILGLTEVQACHLVLAKYRLRMYDNNGENNFDEENNEIGKVIKSIHLASREQISLLYSGINMLANKCLKPRLEQIEGEYLVSMSLLAHGFIESSEAID